MNVERKKDASATDPSIVKFQFFSGGFSDGALRPLRVLLCKVFCSVIRKYALFSPSSGHLA